MTKIKIDSGLYTRAKKVAEEAGYGSVEEFVTHLVEKEVALIESSPEADTAVSDRLRGLGYID